MSKKNPVNSLALFLARTANAARRRAARLPGFKQVKLTSYYQNIFIHIPLIRSTHQSGPNDGDEC